MWSHREEGVRELREQHENRSKLPGVILPEEIQYTSSLEQAIVGKDLCVLAVPSVYTRSTAEQMKPFVTDGQIIVSVAKGIEESTLMIQTDIISQVLPQVNAAVLSGPSHAEEVGRDIPTTVVAGAADRETAEYIQNLFMSESFRVYTSPDMLGIEKCHCTGSRRGRWSWLRRQYEGSIDHQRNRRDESAGCGYGWSH